MNTSLSAGIWVSSINQRRGHKQISAVRLYISEHSNQKTKDTWLCSTLLCLSVTGVFALPFSGSLFSSLSSILESGNDIGETLLSEIHNKLQCHPHYSGTLVLGILM